MKNKKILKIALFSLTTTLVVAGYLLWATSRADYFASLSRQTANPQEKITSLEESITLYPKTENITALADAYISVGRDDLAEKIMLGRGEASILNKLGNLYLSENKIKEAENTFKEAKNNPDSLRGLILVELKYGDRGVAENYLNQLRSLDPSSAGCYASFLYLNDFKRAKTSYTEAKTCKLGGIDKYFSSFNENQNPIYLKLEAANLYYSQNYLKMAENDILALLMEKDNYRDAHILASKIYEKEGNGTKSAEEINKAKQIDPVFSFQ